MAQSTTAEVYDTTNTNHSLSIRPDQPITTAYHRGGTSTGSPGLLREGIVRLLIHSSGPSSITPMSHFLSGPRDPRNPRSPRSPSPSPRPPLRVIPHLGKAPNVGDYLDEALRMVVWIKNISDTCLFRLCFVFSSIHVFVTVAGRLDLHVSEEWMSRKAIDPLVWRVYLKIITTTC
jgi:hypothetical protein